MTPGVGVGRNERKVSNTTLLCTLLSRDNVIHVPTVTLSNKIFAYFNWLIKMVNTIPSMTVQFIQHNQTKILSVLTLEGKYFF